MAETDYSIRSFKGGYDDNLTYLVTCMRTGNQFLVDASVSLEKIKPFIKPKGLIALFITHTHGDHIAYLDEYGFVFIVDRLKDMAIVSGFNVFPREIDEVLISHPKIIEAATIGIQDDYRGEVIKAFISVKKGEDIDEEELKKFCAQNLVKYKIPTVFEFTNNLPKTPVGKIDKKKLNN